MSTLPCGTRNFDYAADMAVIRTKTQWVMFGAFFVLLFTAPLYLNHYWLGVTNLVGITIIAATGLNILVGYCGQLSIGHAGFIAVGAYTSVLLTKRLDVPFLIAVIAAGLVAGIIGLIFGIPSIRVKGFYLAISTIAAQLIIIWIINHWTALTGGFNGITVPYASIGSFIFNTEDRQFYLIIGIAVICVFLAKNIVRTKIGRAFIAIRDNDLAAEVMGVNLFYYKMLAFFIGCFFAGIAGALLAPWVGTVNAEQFTMTESVLYIGMLIIGGLGTIIGPIFGVILIRLLQQVLVTEFIPFMEKIITFLPGGWGTSLTPLLFGLIIILFLILEPRGLAHRWTLFKSWYRLWPFSY